MKIGATSSAELASCLAVSLLLHAATVSAEPSIADLRNEIMRWRSDSDYTSPLLDLRGFSRAWELDLGESVSALVISRNLGGELFLFSSRGSLKKRISIGEAISVSLCEIDGSPTAELLLDQVDGRGTGLLQRTIHIYTAEGREIIAETPLVVLERIFHQPDQGDGYFTWIQGFVRCDPFGAKGSHSLAYSRIAFEGPGRTTTERISLEFQDGRLLPMHLDPAP